MANYTIEDLVLEFARASLLLGMGEPDAISVPRKVFWQLSDELGTRIEFDLDGRIRVRGQTKYIWVVKKDG